MAQVNWEARYKKLSQDQVQAALTSLMHSGKLDIYQGVELDQPTPAREHLLKMVCLTHQELNPPTNNYPWNNGILRRVENHVPTTSRPQIATKEDFRSKKPSSMYRSGHDSGNDHDYQVYADVALLEHSQLGIDLVDEALAGATPVIWNMTFNTWLSRMPDRHYAGEMTFDPTPGEVSNYHAHGYKTGHNNEGRWG